MPTTGTAAARISTAVNFSATEANITPQPAPVALCHISMWFFWIVGLAALNSVLDALGSQMPRFSGLGIVSQSGDRVLQLVIGSWAAVAFLVVGYAVAEGKRWAFFAGVSAYALDATVSAANGDYLNMAFHVLLLGLMFIDLRKAKGAAARQSATAA